MIAILHNIRSMHNVGSIFRTADAAGVEKIYLCGITPAPIDKFGRQRQQITKVSLGAEKYVEWETCKSTTHLIEKLKKQEYKILAIEQSEKAVPYYKLNLEQFHNPKDPSLRSRFAQNDKEKGLRTAIVLGNEIRGLSPALLKRADKILEIPMYGKKESLNVAVAFGIITFHLVQK